MAGSVPHRKPAVSSRPRPPFVHVLLTLAVVAACLAPSLSLRIASGIAAIALLVRTVQVASAARKRSRPRLVPRRPPQREPRKASPTQLYWRGRPL